MLMKDKLSELGVNAFINYKELEDVELMQQIQAVSEHPARVGKVGIMPDAHLGYGMPIGCVLATKGAVIPNAVGVDIGCSMSLVKTSLKKEDITEEDLKRIVGGSKEYPGGIYGNIPVGQRHNSTKQDSPIFAAYDDWCLCVGVCLNEIESAQYQIGTLGGGNHFIEIQVGDDDSIYIMIHSGSRNLGYKVCSYYNKLAEELCTKFFQHDVVKHKLAFLPSDTKEYYQYMDEMNLCMRFAKENHLLMQKKIAGIINHVMGENVTFEEPLITTHNYAAFENHFGQNVLVHRKGAIMAREGVEAIIPGSQGTSSYVVRGLGNAASLCSASHGSGRKMSRRKAKEELNLAEEQKLMEGIIHRMDNESSLEEAPSAYKDISDVLRQEATLVEPILKLRPLAVVKG